MRLRPERVQVLSHKVAEALKGLKRIQILATPEKLEGTIRRVILADLRAEVDIEKEAEEILKKHRGSIDLHNMSWNTLMDKTKRELAKQRKMVL